MKKVPLNSNVAFIADFEVMHFQNSFACVIGRPLKQQAVLFIKTIPCAPSHLLSWFCRTFSLGTWMLEVRAEIWEASLHLTWSCNLVHWVALSSDRPDGFNIYNRVTFNVSAIYCSTREINFQENIHMSSDIYVYIGHISHTIGDLFAHVSFSAQR